MKKMSVMLAAGAMIFPFSCGQAENTEDMRTGIMDGTAEISQDADETYSLTGTELDFSTAVSGSIDRYDAASLLIYGSITGYDYEETDSGVLITADLEAGYDGMEDTQKHKVTAELVRNPYSCFDGYSIVSFSSTTADNMQGNAELVL